MAFTQFLKEIRACPTRQAFLGSRILKTPFWAIYLMLPVILHKDLNATPFQIAFMIALKPTVSILSVYWSSLTANRPDRLLSNVVWASTLSLLPFFLFPFVNNVWLFIGIFGFHMMFHRGVIPAWMEILKRNIPDGSREKLFAYCTAIGYLGNAVLPFLLGSLLDGYHQAWRWIFPVTALLSLFPVWLQCRIPYISTSEKVKSTPPLSLRKPWKEALEVLRKRPDFGRFQMGFMLAGGGLMVVHAALPVFFVDHLNLSYTEVAIALTLCKGIGFALSTPTWTVIFNKTSIFRISSRVFAFAALFPILIMLSQFQLGALYIGYLCYGVMQAGSELSWNMSGPIFAGSEDSTVYSSINILTVGLRGCVCPFIGAALCHSQGANSVMILSCIMCAGGALLEKFTYSHAQSRIQL